MRLVTEVTDTGLWSEQAAGKLRRVGSLSPDRLARSLSLASSVDVKPAADVYISHGAEPHDYRTEIVTGDERQAWWDRGVEIYPPYAEYQDKTDREIPVFVARRTD